jgi:hypothetical protein
VLWADTRPALAMPDEYKTDDPVESYRNYYVGAKRHLLQYTNRTPPEWMTEKFLWEVRHITRSDGTKVPRWRPAPEI